MKITSRGLRFLHKKTSLILSNLRRIFYLIMYPGISIHRSVHLDWGVRLKATDGGSIHLSPGVSIERNSTIVAKYGKILIGENTFIGEGSILVANEQIKIDSDCLFAAGVTIRDQNHRIDLSTSIRNQGSISAPIQIGRDVWLGSRVTVLKGVTIGDHAVAGANSLLITDVPPCVIVAGTPAKFIKVRPRSTSN